MTPNPTPTSATAPPTGDSFEFAAIGDMNPEGNWPGGFAHFYRFFQRWSSEVAGSILPAVLRIIRTRSTGATVLRTAAQPPGGVQEPVVNVQMLVMRLFPARSRMLAGPPVTVMV